MKNLYDVLEVSKFASKEIIEKAYKTLAKRYHPDLQEESNKKQAEEMMKQINEAYSILSDEQKRKEYDHRLEEEKKNLEVQNNITNNNNANNYNNDDNIRNVYQTNYQNQRKSEEELRRYYEEKQRKIEQEVERKAAEQYRKNYIDYLHSLGYRIKHKWRFKDFIVIFAVIGIIILIGYILWIIPSTHDWLIRIYNDNLAIKLVVNIIAGIFKGIGSFFRNLFNFNK